MRTIKENNLTTIIADEGHKIHRKGETYFTDKIYLGKYDDPQNYEELSDEAVEEILKEENLESAEQITLS